LNARARAFGATCVLACAAWAAVARADNGAIDSARAAYWAMDYEKSLSLAEGALKTTGLGHADYVEATRLRAMSLAAAGKGDAARDAFVVLLETSPDFELDPKLGPRFRAPYAEARAYWAAHKGAGDGAGATLSVAYRSEDGALHAEVKDPRGELRAVVVAYRTSAGEAFTSARGTAAGGAAVVVASGAEQVDYYAQALNALDQVVAEVGDADDPRTFAIPARRALFTPSPAPSAPAGDARGSGASGSSSVFASPWFWAGVGVVVTGAVVGGYFALRGGGDSGTIVARPELRCGAHGDACP
jgi:hypothetical protein